MRLTLTEETLREIRDLRSLGVLADVDPHKINGDSNNTIIMCSDGHQSVKTLTKHGEYLEKDGQHICCHAHMLNGGALLIAPHLPNKGKQPADLVLLEQIEQSFKLKGANTLVLYVHAPCGAALLNNLNFVDMLVHLFEAKDRIKGHFSWKIGLKVVCFCQIDYGDKKLTYFVSREKFTTWRSSQGKDATG